MERNTQSKQEEPRQENPAGFSGTAEARNNEENPPQMGNRKLVGKISVKYIDTVILVSALVLIALFVFFLGKH